jgi:hypothetical protein
LPYVLQSFELHADQFAVSFAASQILRGHDPAGAMAGPDINLVYRVAALAAACAIFAVDWESAQLMRDPNTATHPSVAARYISMLDQIERTCMEFSADFPSIRSIIFNLIVRLSELAEDFSTLLATTPLIAKTPAYKAACSEIDILFGDVSSRIDPLRRPFIYYPRR